MKKKWLWTIGSLSLVTVIAVPTAIVMTLNANKKLDTQKKDNDGTNKPQLAPQNPEKKSKKNLEMMEEEIQKIIDKLSQLVSTSSSNNKNLQTINEQLQNIIDEITLNMKK